LNKFTKYSHAGHSLLRNDLLHLRRGDEISRYRDLHLVIKLAAENGGRYLLIFQLLIYIHRFFYKSLVANFSFEFW